MYWVSKSRGKRKNVKRSLDLEESVLIKSVLVELVATRGFELEMLDFICKSNPRSYAQFFPQIKRKDYPNTRIVDVELMSNYYAKETKEIILIDMRSGDTQKGLHEDILSLGDRKSVNIKVSIRGTLSTISITSIVMVTNINQNRANAILDNNRPGINATVYSYTSIYVNPTTHNMVPKHEIVGETLFSDPESLPKISSNDPIIKFIGGSPGDLIKITKDEDVSFRFVIDHFFKKGMKNEKLPCGLAMRSDFVQTRDSETDKTVVEK